MSEQANAAHRLESILRNAVRLPEATSTVEVWTQVFSITGPDAQTTAVKVVHMIGLLRQQTNEIRLKMHDTPIKPQRYEPSLNHVLEALDIQTLSSSWQQRKRYLTPEVLSSVSWCADTLPNEEELIEQGSLGELKEELQRFRATVNEGSLPDYAKSFVLRQIEIIEQAVHEYPVIGAKAFRRASVECFFDLSENQDVYAKHSDEQEMSKLREFWGRVQNMAEKAGPWLALAQAVEKLPEIMGG